MAAPRPATLRGSSVLRGMVRVARGHADGIAQFAGTSQGFLASLAPLIAFPLVGTAFMLMDGDGAPAITDLLATMAVLLAPPVLSQVQTAPYLPASVPSVTMVWWSVGFAVCALVLAVRWFETRQL